jgi:hypothetical protein
MRRDGKTERNRTMKRHYLILVLLAAVALVGCSEDDETADPVRETGTLQFFAN